MDPTLRTIAAHIFMQSTADPVFRTLIEDGLHPAEAFENVARESIAAALTFDEQWRLATRRSSPLELTRDDTPPEEPHD